MDEMLMVLCGLGFIVSCLGLFVGIILGAFMLKEIIFD